MDVRNFESATTYFSRSLGKYKLGAWKETKCSMENMEEN